MDVHAGGVSRRPRTRRGLQPMARHCADLDTPLTGQPTGTRRSDRFLAGLRAASRVTFVSHVQPDPASLGSMLALAHLIECRLNKPTRLTRDGPTNGAE